MTVKVQSFYEAQLMVEQLGIPNLLLLLFLNIGSI